MYIRAVDRSLLGKAGGGRGVRTRKPATGSPAFLGKLLSTSRNHRLLCLSFCIVEKLNFVFQIGFIFSQRFSQEMTKFASPKARRFYL